jgi:hypothetical protein
VRNSSQKVALDLSSRWLDPLRPMLARVPIDPLPDAVALQEALGALIAPERFEVQTKKRTRGAPFSLEQLYEARIALSGFIPTRAHVHDLMNALVWATFPRSKRALARRQYRALVAQVGERPTKLPNARTRERDVLAMIDEGGLVVMAEARIVFGHAVYEHLASSEALVRAFPIVLEPQGDVDAALEAWVETLDTDVTRPDAVALSR